jgi:hypothetical protein
MAQGLSLFAGFSCALSRVIPKGKTREKRVLPWSHSTCLCAYCTEARQWEAERRPRAWWNGCSLSDCGGGGAKNWMNREEGRTDSVAGSRMERDIFYILCLDGICFVDGKLRRKREGACERE